MVRDDNVVVLMMVAEFVSSALLRDVEWAEDFVHGGERK